LLAQEAMTQESHEYWLTMAEFWFKLANHEEESKGMGHAAHRSPDVHSRKSKDTGESE
jgi:hypothetical protein